MQRQAFTTVHSEGALLPADLLVRVRDNDRDLPGLTPDAYHLPGSMRLGEAASRAWNALLGAWATFRDARVRLPEDDLGTTLTRERWLLPLFQELNYGRLPTRTAEDIEGKSYPVSHGYGHVPVHLLGCNVELDKQTPGAAGAARSSPHSLVQEYLNRSDSNLWGIVSNGLKLRLLRDNLALTRQAYLEFDLEAMMDGEVYSDFVVLFLTLHQSRLENNKPEDTFLEQWSKDAADKGARALDKLREGVEQAISSLGRGFLAQRSNDTLRANLRSGELSTQDYYRQLLRLVYRLLFLFVAEDRDLLLVPDADDVKKARYAFYSTRRLRDLADTLRGSRHHDLYVGLKLVMRRLGDEGEPELGLPALGSFLFSDRATPDLFTADLPNAYLLQAVRNLAYADIDGTRRAVDYKNLGSEELGSVYESLLELHPELDTAAATFALTTAAGNERKTTGSYYTPSSLIKLLLDSALEPVLAEAVKSKTREEAEQAILNLKVVDPACGSGHFLIAAAQRLAKRLAAVRTGDEEPAPQALRHALRDVIGRCIYGVDINEMSAELCKVALWMEALEPGKPLTFLEHRIQVGNSLMGTTPELIQGGLPYDTFKPIEGDDKKLASAAKKRNREEQRGQTGLFESAPADENQGIAEGFADLTDLPDDSPEQIRVKEERLEQLLQDKRYAAERLVADAWCAAFVWRKETGRPPAVTTGTLRRLREKGALDDAQHREVERIVKRYRFFHWHLAFPEVFPPKQAGGFDVVLGNPPWERIKIQEKEWFANRHPDINEAHNTSQRSKLISKLRQSDPALYDAFLDDKRQAEGESHYARNSGYYPLTGRGDVNTYPLFAELGRNLQNPSSCLGFILPSAVATGDTTKFFFQDLIETRTLLNFFDFENTNGLFQGADRNYKFCLITLGGEKRSVPQAEYAFFALDPEDVRGDDKRFNLSPKDIALLNPNTKTCPVFRSSRDAEIIKGIYRRVPVLVNETTGEEPWGIKFMTMFHMSNDSELFRTREHFQQGFTLSSNRFIKENETYLPLYEGKMLWQFDHRFSDVDHGRSGQQLRGSSYRSNSLKYKDPLGLAIPRYWVNKTEVVKKSGVTEWTLAFRRVGGTVANVRTSAFAILPEAGIGDSLFIIDLDDPKGACCLVATFNSFILDYSLRNKMSGINLSFYLIKQLPILPPDAYTPTDLAFVIPRVLELTYTAWDLQPFAQDLGYDSPPFVWDEERRFWLRAELDALYFHLYGIVRDDVDYIMDTFPIVKRKDEAKHGCYRTKEAILEIFDETARCKAEGREYQTRLEPPPASPLVAHPGKAVGVR